MCVYVCVCVCVCECECVCVCVCVHPGSKVQFKFNTEGSNLLTMPILIKMSLYPYNNTQNVDLLRWIYCIAMP